jgi:hypothetical protein
MPARKDRRMVDQLDSERRELLRFQLRAPAVVKAAMKEGVVVTELFTRDICSHGAYFQTETPLPVGVNVQITLFLLTSAIREWRGRPYKVRVTTEGTVVRSEGDGMAVAFHKGYRLSPVPA